LSGICISTQTKKRDFQQLLLQLPAKGEKNTENQGFQQLPDSGQNLVFSKSIETTFWTAWERTQAMSKVCKRLSIVHIFFAGFAI